MKAKLLKFFIFSLIFMGIISGLMRLRLPWISSYKNNIEEFLSSQINHTVKIEQIRTGWYFIIPVIKLHNVFIETDNKKNLEITDLMFGVDFFRSIIHWRLETGLIFFDGINLTFVQDQQFNWQIQGFKNNLMTRVLDSTGTIKLFLDRILAHHKIILKHINITVKPYDKKLRYFENIGLVIQHSADIYKFKLKGNIGRQQISYLELIADLDLNSENFMKSSGKMHLNIHQTKLQDLDFLNKNNNISGLTSSKIWLEIDTGQLHRLQALFNLQDTKFSNLQKQFNLPIESIDYANGHILLTHATNHWQLIMQPITWQYQGQKWPKNSLKINYDSNLKSGDLYIKVLPMNYLQNFKQTQVWHEFFKKYNVKGILEDTQLNFKQQQIDNFITHLKKFEWQPVGKLPGMQNLALFIQFNKQKGKIKLQSNAAKLIVSKVKTIDNINLVGQCTWNTIVEPVVNVDLTCNNWQMSHPEFYLEFKTNITNLLANDRHIDFESKWSAKNPTQWLEYLPDITGKPKLTHWLKHDIHKLQAAKGTMLFSGKLAEFPYDHSAGKFLITSDLTGVDLSFAPGWPEVTDINGILQVDKRNLAASLDSGMLGMIPISKVTLGVADLGLDKETLLLHGTLASELSSMLQFLNKSPIKKAFRLLDHYIFKGVGLIALDIEAPLYPENDDLLIDGKLVLRDAEIHGKTDTIAWEVKNLTGSILFDEFGPNNGALKASLANNNINLAIHDLSQNKPGIAIDAWGDYKYDNKLLAQGNIGYVLKWKKYFDNNNSGSITGKLDCRQLQWKISAAIKDIIKTYPKDINLAATFPKSINNWQLKLASNNNITVNLALNKIAPTAIDFTFNTDSLDIQKILQIKPDSKNLNNSNSEWQRNIKKIKLISKKFMYGSAELGSGSINIDLPDSGHVKLIYENSKFGNVNLEAERSQNIWELKHGKVISDNFDVDLEGSWHQEIGKEITNIELHSKFRKLADILRQYNISSTVDAKTGAFGLVGSWDGKPSDFSLSKFEGEVGMTLKDGVIKELSNRTRTKLELGKILNVLSLQTLPRRLKLDFTDLAKTDYVFDRYNGYFAVSKGIMHTKRSVLDGPVAYVSMQGDIDLEHKLYDVTLSIAPHLTSSVPVAAAIVGGPIVGAAAWVANQVVTAGVNQLSGYAYKVTGSWDKPEIKRLNFLKQTFHKIYH